MNKIIVPVLTIIAAIPAAIQAQSRFMLGFNAGGNISRVYGADTFPANFSRRNRVGFHAGITATYDIKPFVALHLGVNYVNKGYKVNNDTLRANPSVVHKISSINIPLGLTFRQQFNPGSYIHEKAGFIANFSLRNDSVTMYNASTDARFRVNDVAENKFYPMFYLGFGIGGKTENGDRYEFTVTYNQSFSTESGLSVQYGQGYLKNFPLTYRGGFVQFGVSYFINLENFRKSDEYFID